MKRVVIELVAVGQLDDFSDVHDGDARRDVAHYGEVVRDKQIGELESLLELFQKIDNLRLNRDVERRDRLVADDEFRVHREGARDADALALAAGKLVRIAIRMIGLKADEAQAARSRDLPSRCRMPAREFAAAPQ